MALYVPILYGKFLLDPNYPVASIHSKAGDACGLLLTLDSNDMLLWQLENARGKLFVLPRSEVIRVEIRPSSTVGSVLRNFKNPCDEVAR
jgi:hypothetical protein